MHSDEMLLFGKAAELAKEKIDPVNAAGKKYIGLEHIEPESLSLSGHGYAEDVASAKGAFKKGDILFGKLRPYFRKVVMAPFDGICSTDIWVVRAKKGVDQAFLYYWMASKEFVDGATRGSEGTRMPRAKWDYVSRFQSPITDPKEQKAIGQVLRSLDEKIEHNRQMCETLEKTASTLFKSWFVDFDPVKAKIEARTPEGMATDLLALFPDNFEESELGEIPKGWKIDEIGKLVDSVGGATPSTKSPEFWDGEHYWATPKDLSSLTHRVLLKTERKITDEGVAKISSGLLPKGTVLLSSRAPIGYVAVAEVPVAINQGFIAMKCTKKLGTQFALQWTLANLEKIKSHANGSTFQEISKKAFRPIKVCYPNNGLLEAFEEICSTLHLRCVELVRQSNDLTKTRDTLLPKLISGELRVEDVEADL